MKQKLFQAQKLTQPERDIFSFKNLLRAYYQCRKSKRHTTNAAKFELNFEVELLRLERELKNKSYEPGKHTCFAIIDPKLREVWAADFRDRIVHHLLVSYLEPIWEKKFVFHSYACRKEKGAHKAIAYLKKSIDPKLFYLQVDIRSFFVSIDKRILFAIIQKHLRNPDILWLTEKIVFQNPTLNYCVKGDIKLLRSIPRHKSLFGNPSHQGLPIGNLTSQFFANVYLNELDQFVKHTLKCPHSFRYMDDLLLLHPSKTQLLFWRDEISQFVEKKLLLKLHPKKQVLQQCDKGINFCGYITKPDHILIRRGTVKKLKNTLWQFNQKILNSLDPNDHLCACDKIFYDRFSVFPEFLEDFQHIFSSLNSTYGFFKHANCFGLRKTLYEKHFGILKIYLRPADKNYAYFMWDEN
jgi:retron-type reverse transcriptase